MRVWLGGAPCSGKSTVAELLAVQLSLPVYRADSFFTVHGKSAPAGSVLNRIAASSFALNFQRPVDAMLQDFVSASREEVPLIDADLSAPHWRNGAIVEGCALLPSAVRTVASPGDAAVFMLPTEQFQREAYRARPWAAGLLAEVPDPALVWENWRQRDVAFANLVGAEARTLGLPVVIIDGTRSVYEVAALVHAHVVGAGV